jgi:hypothetical protein
VENVRKYLPESDATSKGRMNQIRQNIRSTQPAVEQPAPETDMVQEEKCNFIYSALMDTNQIYTDLTGRFPTISLSGNKYILILYHYDSNRVLSDPIKNRGDKDMVSAFDLLIQSLIICGLKPHLQRLDNEASLALLNYVTKQGISYQLTPPHIHWRNNAERVIQTFNNHFIAGLFRGSNMSTKIVGQALTSSNNNIDSLAKIQNKYTHVGICPTQWAF